MYAVAGKLGATTTLTYAYSRTRNCHTSTKLTYHWSVRPFRELCCGDLAVVTTTSRSGAADCRDKATSPEPPVVVSPPCSGFPGRSAWTRPPLIPPAVWVVRLTPVHDGGATMLFAVHDEWAVHALYDLDVPKMLGQPVPALLAGGGGGGCVRVAHVCGSV